MAVWRAARLRLRGDARRGYAVHCSARGGVGEEQSAAVDAPSSSRYPSIGQLLDWCSALCDVQVGLLASTAAPVGEGEERTAIATSRSSPPSAAALSSLSSLSCSLSLLSSLSALLEQHFSPIAQRSRQLAVAIKAIAHSTQQQRRGKERRTADAAAVADRPSQRRTTAARTPCLRALTAAERSQLTRCTAGTRRRLHRRCVRISDRSVQYLTIISTTTSATTSTYLRCIGSA